MEDFIKTTAMRSFSKVVWFVEPEDELEIQKQCGVRSDFVFVKTISEFKKNISEDSFLVFSVDKSNDSDEILKVVQSYPQNIFHQLFVPLRLKQTKTLMLLALEKNIKQGMWLKDILDKVV